MQEKYSYSKMETYEGCPFKYKLKYVDKNYFNSSSIATEIGTAVHSCEEDIANAIKDKQPINYNQIKNKLILKVEELKYKYPSDFWTLDKSNRTYQDKIDYYLEIGIYRLENLMKAHPSYEILGAEKEFSFEYNNEVIFSGYIDRVIKDNETGNIIVQDIKTWAEPKDQKDLVTPLQFVVYTLAAKELYGVDCSQVECSYDLPFCDKVQKAGTKGFVERGKTKLNKLFDKIKAADFTPKPTPFCAWCEFSRTNPNAPKEGRHMCPYHLMWTRDNKTFAKEFEWQGMENHEKVLEAYNIKLQKTIKIPQ